MLCQIIGFSQSKTQLDKSIKNSIIELREFVSIPNDALNADDIKENINWLTSSFTKRGFVTKTIKTEGLPLFYAELPLVKNKPTILFYMHFDGQAVDQSKWNQENAYNIVLKNTNQEGNFSEIAWNNLNKSLDNKWRLFGRSTSDDKGPIVLFLNAIDLIRENNREIPFNVKVILDSEEEKGSKPLPKAVQENRDLLKADFLIINDGPVHPSNKPTLVFGCRGITNLSITTFGPIKPQHSGHYGNYAPNPGFKLAQLLSGMKDEEGRVLINGYYDGIVLDEDTKKVLKSVPDNISLIHNNLGISSPEKVGSYYQESLQFPSLNIRGLSSGWTGKKARTIVPDRAVAEIDIRLVMESDGERLKKLIKNYIKSKGYRIVTQEPTFEERKKYDKIVMITESGVTKPFRTNLDDPNAKWIENILVNTFHQDVVKIRTMGGTVPIATFINTLKIPAFILPMVNPDNNQHSPNENLKIGQIEYGIKVFYNLLTTNLE